MSSYVALFRGINVGGRHPLPMQQLRDILASLGCKDVKTYIQSGNAVFRSAKSSDNLATEIKAAIDKQFGFAPRVLLLTVADYRAIVAANPYPDAEESPKHLHVCFLAGVPEDPDIKALDALKSQAESYRLDGAVLYLHAPDGIGRSKFAEKLEKCLGVEATGRNWRTVTKLHELAMTVIN